MLDTFRPLRSIDLAHPWDGIRQLPDETLTRMYGGKSPKSIRKSLARLTQLPAHDPRRSSAEAHFRPQFAAAVDEALKLYDRALTPQLDLARDAGVLTVDVDCFELDDPGAEHVAWFRERLVKAWNDPGGTVLLDPRSRKIVRRKQGSARLPVAMDRSKRAAAGTGFVRHLPTFPSAPMEHVLEARAELADSRTAYRRSMRELSTKLAASALDDALDSEIGEYWNDVLCPALDGLSSSVKATRLARGTAQRLFGDATSRFATGGLTVAVAAAHELAGLATLGGIGGVSAYVIGTAMLEAQEQRATPRARELVYRNGVETQLFRAQHR